MAGAVADADAVTLFKPCVETSSIYARLLSGRRVKLSPAAGKGIPGKWLVRQRQRIAGGGQIFAVRVLQGIAASGNVQKAAAVRRKDQPALRRSFCLHRALPHELRGQAFSLLSLRALRERGKDARGVAAREAARCTVFPMRQTKRVAERRWPCPTGSLSLEE